ncbi:MAG: serine/threonine protein kinase, partial [Myxococcales bacterium]|nr:serine/threonine protein kinase [Myxococcales bacterium]
DLLEGESLREVLQRGPVAPAAAGILVEDIADALSYAHARGVVHRDVKPENVFLAERRGGGLRAVLLDFGIARMNELTSLTQSGVMIGTPRYMSPEQMEDPRSVDARADVFALAVVLFELLTGTTPHPGDNARQVTLSILAGRMLRVSAVLEDVPPELDQQLQRALQPDPARRHPNIEAFATAVLPLLSSTTVAPSREPTEADHALTWPPMPEDQVRRVLAERALDAPMAPCPQCGALNLAGRTMCMRCGVALH